MRTHYCGDINADAVGQTVEVAGWVHRRRDHGGIIFIDLLFGYARFTPYQ